VTFGNSVATIGNKAFINCIALTSITIPSSVTSIGTEAFANTAGLNSVTFEPNFQPTTFSTTTFTSSGLAQVYMSGDTLSHLNSTFSPPILFFGLNPLFFGANSVTINSTDPPPPPPPSPPPPPISNIPGPIQMCESRFRKCNLNKKPNFYNGNVTIQGTTRPLKLSYLTQTVVPSRNHKLVYANKPNNEYGQRAGGPVGYGQSPKNNFI